MPGPRFMVDVRLVAGPPKHPDRVVAHTEDLGLPEAVDPSRVADPHRVRDLHRAISPRQLTVHRRRASMIAGGITRSEQPRPLLLRLP